MPLEFQIEELSEDHQKYNRNTHTHTHTHTHVHIHIQSKKDSQLQKLLKKRICHINMFKHLKVYLSFVE